MSVVAVIPARGGSKGIPRKNLMSICGKPLIAWSIEQANAAQSVAAVYVSSDDDEILRTAQQYGARPIRRPPDISGDRAGSEAAWLHALDLIERQSKVELMIGIQATSPIREAADFDAAVDHFRREPIDSLLSCCEIQDFFMWKKTPDGSAVGTNHDFTDRQPRQAIEKRYLENGSFYVFKPELLRRVRNRLGGRIGIYSMALHKMFQIDDPEDAKLCEIIMRGYGYAPPA